MSTLEYFLFKSLSLRKPRVRAKLKKRCVVVLKIEESEAPRQSDSSVHSVPTFQSASNLSKDVSAATNETFVLTDAPGISDWSRSLADLVLSIEADIEPAAGDHSLVRPNASQDLRLIVSAKPHCRVPYNNTILSESRVKSGSPDPAYAWLRNLVFSTSGRTQITFHYQKHMTYETGDLCWRFVIDHSPLREMKVIAVTSFEPDQLFWSVVARHSKAQACRPVSVLHRLESMVETIWNIYQAEFVARSDSMQQLFAMRNIAAQDVDLEVRAFSDWCRSVLHVITANLVTILGSVLAAEITKLIDSSSAHHLQRLEFQLARLQKLNSSASKSTDYSLSTLQKILSDQLSQRQKWLVLCVLQTLKGMSDELLERLWCLMIGLIPDFIKAGLSSTAEQQASVGFSVNKFVKSAHQTLQLDSGAVYSSIFGCQANGTAPASTPGRAHTLVFDVNGRQLVYRVMRARNGELAQGFVQWDGHMVLVTQNKILANSTLSDSPWDTRTFLKAKSAHLKQGQSVRFNLDLFFLRIHSVGYHLRVNYRMEPCLSRQLYHSDDLVMVTQKLRFDFSKQTLVAENEWHSHSSDYMVQLKDKAGIRHTIYQVTSIGYTNLHYTSFQEYQYSTNFRGMFILECTKTKWYCDFEVDELNDEKLACRLACPVPLRLVGPEAKKHIIDYNDWVSLAMVEVDPEFPEKFQLFAYFQTVEVRENPDRTYSLITRAELLEFSTRPCKIKETRYWLYFDQSASHTLSTYMFPQPIEADGSIAFDPEDPGWKHHFAWKRTSRDTLGIRLTPRGDYTVFAKKSNRFQVVSKSRMSLGSGRYEWVRPSVSESSPPAIWSRVTTTKTGCKKCTLHELQLEIE